MKRPSPPADLGSYRTRKEYKKLTEEQAEFNQYVPPLPEQEEHQRQLAEELRNAEEIPYLRKALAAAARVPSHHAPWKQFHAAMNSIFSEMLEEQYRAGKLTREMKWDERDGWYPAYTPTPEFAAQLIEEGILE